MASTYPYSKLPDRSIRLLRLLPSRGRESPIHGKMICCPLPHDILEDGLYEALSYVWGSPDDPRCIHLQDDDLLGHGTTRPSSGVLSVTRNLHEALIRLRHAHVDRILWIDAICINQADIEERNQQVAIMAQIYATASRVLVWLGEDNGDGSEEALDEILAKAKETPDSKMKTSESSSNELIALLQRPWFRRVWILQEVAAARSILVMCGARTIDGHSFHLGVTAALQDVEQEKPPAAMRLMQDTFLRRYHLPADQGRFALGIAPLPDLLDSYMTSEATDPRDKVFALIGLASGDLVGSGLMADYSLALGELVKRLCSFCFGTALTVGCFGVEEQVALLRGTGHVLGRV
ncbi:heterokaryon incompatibility protein-domain-containing protein, partial [Cercophora newfieldiana]